MLQMWVNFLSLYRYCTICEQQQHSGIKIWYLLTKSTACDCCHWLEFDAFFTYVGRVVQLVVVTLHWSVKIATLCSGPQAIPRVGNGYDQAQLRSIKMADVEYGEFRLSRIMSTWHLIRRPYCAWWESWDRLIFWVWETAAAGWDIADMGKRKFRRIDRNCHGLLIVTAFQSRRLFWSGLGK